MSQPSERTAREGPAADSAQSVLVVDDDTQLRNLLCTVLTPLGCDIVSAGSGEAALKVLLQRKVAVIVLDINMPGMNGFETAELVRNTERLASTPIIFLTGHVGQDGDLERGYDLGAVDYLVKPVSSHVLYAKVKALLELDQSFARLRAEAAEFHEKQLQAARATEIRQREELEFTRRRERLTNIFAEASIDLASLEQSIVTELSKLFGGDCVLRLASPGHGWHDSLSYAESGGASRLNAWLVEMLDDKRPRETQYQEIMVEELTARGRRVGVICVGRAAGPRFSDMESALFRGVSAAAALAVSNATLYRVQAEYAAVMQATGDAILAVDADGIIRSCNKAATALFGGDYDSLMGRSILNFAIDADRQRLQDQLALTLAGQEEVSMEMRCDTKDSRQIEVVVTLSPIGDSVELHVAAVVHDLTEIREAQQEIRRLASHDPLTDLANRRELNQRLAAAVRKHAHSDDPVAVLYMDINQFKLVNDTYGHDTGDDLLVEVATRLRASVGADTLVCRVGGDEFIVLLDDLSSISAAVAVGNRILAEVQGEPVPCRNATIQPSISMGISCLGDSAHTAEELLFQADLAMFEAKKNRLDECLAYTDLIGSRHLEQAHLRAEVSDAIKRSEFRMVYQPIINAATGVLVGMEALVRWRVNGEEVPASEIIELAETSNQIGTLGPWILRRSFDDFMALGRDDLQLHVNLSPEQVLESDFLDGLTSAYRESGIAPSRVCLELTEQAFTGKSVPVYTALRQARDMGFSLAIDDFGVEYASMTNLMHVPVDWLKIDRSFIAEIRDNEWVQRVVRGQIAVAAAMKVNLIAEGVEDQEQSDWLLDEGCLLHQGYLYAHPTETADLAAVVEKYSAVGSTELGDDVDRRQN